MAASGSVFRQCADHCTRGRRTLAPLALSLSLHHPHPTTQVRNIDLGPAIAKTTVANLKSKVKRLGGELASQRSVAARAEVRRRDCATRPHACCARLAPRCPSACRAQRRAALSSRRTPAHPIASVLSHRHCNATLRSPSSFPPTGRARSLGTRCAERRARAGGGGDASAQRQHGPQRTKAANGIAPRDGGKRAPRSAGAPGGARRRRRGAVAVAARQHDDWLAGQGETRLCAAPARGYGEAS